MLTARTDGERAFSAPAMIADVPGEVIIIRAGGSYDGKQGMSLATGVSSRSAGARAVFARSDDPARHPWHTPYP